IHRAAISGPLHTPAGLIAARVRTIRPHSFVRLSVTRRKNLLIRDHALYFADVTITHQRRRSQIPFPFLTLGCQDVAKVRASALHLSGSSQFEALGSALVSLQFRHKSSKNRYLKKSN